MLKAISAAASTVEENGKAWLTLAVTAGSLLLGGCSRDADAAMKSADKGATNAPPAAKIVETLSAFEKQRLTQRFAALQSEAQHNPQAAHLIAALQDPRVHKFLNDLKAGEVPGGTLKRNMFDASDPELGRSVFRVIQASVNAALPHVAEQILRAQTNELRRISLLPGQLDSARRELAAAQKAPPTGDLLDGKQAAQARVNSLTHEMTWAPRSQLATYKIEPVRPIPLDGVYGNLTAAAVTTFSTRVRVLNESVPHIGLSTGNETGLGKIAIRELCKHASMLDFYVKADWKTVSACFGPGGVK